MLKFACKDAGLDCDFIAYGNTIEEVKQTAFEHAGVVHQDVMQSMTQVQINELVKTVEANIKTD